MHKGDDDDDNNNNNNNNNNNKLSYKFEDKVLLSFTLHTNEPICFRKSFEYLLF